MKAFLVVLALLFATTAIADDGIDSQMVIGNGRMLGAQNPEGRSVPLLGIAGDGSTHLNCQSGEECVITVAKTPAARLGTGGLTFTGTTQQILNDVLPPIITPAVSLTVAAGNVLNSEVTLMATAAPTLAYVVLPAATSNPNAKRTLISRSASPTLILVSGGAAGTDSINSDAAATPYSCPAKKRCFCQVVGASTVWCVNS
jgi:hypothetical protein